MGKKTAGGKEGRRFGGRLPVGRKTADGEEGRRSGGRLQVGRKAVAGEEGCGARKGARGELGCREDT